MESPEAQGNSVDNAGPVAISWTLRPGNSRINERKVAINIVLITGRPNIIIKLILHTADFHRYPRSTRVDQNEDGVPEDPFRPVTHSEGRDRRKYTILMDKNVY